MKHNPLSDLCHIPCLEVLYIEHFYPSFPPRSSEFPPSQQSWKSDWPKVIPGSFMTEWVFNLGHLCKLKTFHLQKRSYGSKPTNPIFWHINCTGKFWLKGFSDKGSPLIQRWYRRGWSQFLLLLATFPMHYGCSKIFLGWAHALLL